MCASGFLLCIALRGSQRRSGTQLNLNATANACADIHADVDTFAGTYDCADVSANACTYDS